MNSKIKFSFLQFFINFLIVFIILFSLSGLFFWQIIDTQFNLYKKNIILEQKKDIYFIENLIKNKIIQIKNDINYISQLSNKSSIIKFITLNKYYTLKNNSKKNFIIFSKEDITIYFDLETFFKELSVYFEKSQSQIYFLNKDGNFINNNIYNFKTQFKEEWEKINSYEKSQFETQNGIISSKKIDNSNIFSNNNFNIIYLVSRYSSNYLTNTLNNLIFNKTTIYRYTLIFILLLSLLISYYISKSNKLSYELKKNTVYDALTGVYNRQGGIDIFELNRKLLKRSKDYMTLFFIDIKNLKKINDDYGHSEGDLVLATTGQILLESIRDSDIAFRMGGDEFVIALSRCREPQAKIVYKRIKSKLENFNTKNKKDYILEYNMSSIELSPYSLDEFDDLIKNATSISNK
ncbi:diguanylate cyclase (GGDEF)-like protein [Hypnocyclicus thermotrophus]|uniref:Diguanylate cyclase (GGDEF)-like protein n=1 Tax=Hypnocyclicus thermotrophus TaxID=1627895 RepID=A0AA46DZ95_9FUSO|nr:GGDEF domain-containing protein [Hypnocyclicus thermotrophus]TDT71481.1 diguanylate cyclase (GGDEF)-like protein [Hypnocyclicus thermotrophus]